MTARCDALQRDNAGLANDQRIVEVIHRRADVARDQEERLADGRGVAKWWLPDDVIFVDAVPKTSVGKFNKRALREQFKNYSLAP